MRELDYIEVGKRIRLVRKERGWSQEQLAKKCQISMSFLGHIERGTRIMSLDTFVGICNALGTAADELLWGELLPPDSVMLDMWDTDKAKKEDTDNYSTYIRIMKSVAEIMSTT